jgi:hypothetical protein
MHEVLVLCPSAPPCLSAAAVLKLALPNLYGWLVMFYVVFHVWLNILGELTRFGDR